MLSVEEEIEAFVANFTAWFRFLIHNYLLRIHSPNLTRNRRHKTIMLGCGY
jgi:hypothetical protein